MSKRLRRNPANCANFDTELCNPRIIKAMDAIDWKDTESGDYRAFGHNKKLIKTIEEICSKCRNFELK